MNSRKRVLILVLVCFFIYFLFSIASLFSGYSIYPLGKINLLSDIVTTPQQKREKEQKALAKSKKTANKNSETDFNLYQTPDLITDFKVGNSCVLPKFETKLKALKQGKPVKIRIAFFGDSMIEGDLMTQKLRELLQKEFGGYGVGFLPIYSEIAGSRASATVRGSGWNDINFKDKSARNLYLSGHYFTGSGKGTYKDNTISEKQNVEKSIIYAGNQNVNISLNNQSFPLQGTDLVNSLTFDKGMGNIISLSSSNPSKLYGVSFESPAGVIVDNFSFRGITGVELGKLDEDFLQSINKNIPYDLIIFQYGVNMLFRPNDTDYKYYEKIFGPVLEKYKKVFNNSEFIVIGSADRAFRYNGEYKTAIGLPNLLELQANFALKNKMAFYNNFATMGGENSIVKWANENPPLANKDYIHPNRKGADILGEKLFNAIVKDYKKFK